MPQENRLQKTDNVLRLIASAPLFENVGPELLRIFAQAGRRATFPKDKVVFLQNDSADYFYIIIKGWIKLSTTTEDGAEALVDILNDGHMFGETVLLDNGQHKFGATLINDAELLVLPNALLQKYVGEDNNLAIGLLKSLELHRRRQFREFEGMRLRSAPQRLGCFLLHLCKNNNSEKAVELEPPYDKSLIAAQLGIKPETFSRSLNTLKAQVGVTKNRSKIIIPNLSLLARYTCSACSDEYPCSDK